MIVDLPYPHKALWPNGRAHHFERSRQFRIHRQWAHVAALAEKAFDDWGNDPVPGSILVHPKPRGKRPDRDNVVASAKAYLDGIADRNGIDDEHFAAPTVEFSTERKSRFVIRIG